MDNKLLRKIEAEEQLSAEESLRLDEALEASDVAGAVRALGDEAPSMAWRSQLNEKLGKATRRQRTRVMWRYGLAVTAGASAMFLFFSLGQQVPTENETLVARPPIADSTSLEDDILSDHQDAMTQASMGVIVSFDGSGGF